MRLLWTALLSSATLVMGTTSGFADGRLALSSFQLDGVTPRSQYQPSQFQLRVMVEGLVTADTDKARNVILQDEFDASMALMEMADDQDPLCTPARKALLALVGTGETAALATTTMAGPAIRTSASTTPQISRSQPAAAVLAGRVRASSSSLSSPTTRQASAVANSSRPPAALPRSASSSLSSSTTRQASAVTNSSRPTWTGGAQQVKLTPTRTVQSSSHSTAPTNTASAIRVSTVSSARDMVVRLQSDVNRMVSAIQSQAFSARR